MRLEHAITVRVPVEEAFSWIEDVGKMQRWMKGFVSIDYLTERKEGNPVGTRFRQKLREAGQINEYMGEITAFERPYLFGVRLGNNAFVADISYRFKAMPDGCRLTYEAVFVFSNVATKCMASLFWWYTHLTMRSQLASYKKTVESQNGVGA